ncbi:MAG TPA: bifunctional diaminohydroxyphosphoribosylaminopyrimidine deaminase/5-amino-6-(5-phosphoribosylamino)uracil reductase RibD [Blastocatellia bacterium]|jgi:pyrimidine deaminase RibD-like protein|nr:bifunctional diaminohydroxyphosphoribosylaminopyrimidine deaminase/5-amino-6-(5-phosphoribosylamino)uracil reductase RibD [Blastocatellia bacterium]
MMDEIDSTFMKRALELARRGAGLVSPNPMVGAVIVNERRVVGEGFHRYESLRHAESYAIEMAGELARGATLYCSLEPCCHHGRTPPCTDALIEAGIARAVVATSDPDSRVSGQGIEQLRAAGIEVEVGLCEREALRLNESYLKFVTTRTPFIHSVIECAAAGASPASDWQPSRRFLDVACEYDLIGTGFDARINGMVLNACSSRSRHRQLIVAGEMSDLPSSIRDVGKIDASFVKVESPAMRDVDARPDLASMLRPLAGRLNVTSVLLLPGFLGIHSSAVIEQSDKLTVIARRADEANSQRMKSICRALEPDIEYAQNFDAESYVEYTGYPRHGGQK